MSSESAPLAEMDFGAEGLEAALEFLKRTRSEMRQLCFVRIWSDRFAVYDVNQDCFQILGLGYPDPDIVPVLDAVNTAFKRETIHDKAKGEYKQFKTGRRYPWAADRVM
ncbi:MAG: hypothetical protein N2C12_14315 [Planctomycetales bacterium]